jgi:LacI family transcriptional regulator
MMGLPKPPDAVFCSNDIIALGVLQFAREHNIRVPDDFGIIGFDDINYASLPLVNMSSVSQPRDKLGEEALQALLREIETYPERNRQRVLVAPELKIRSTT